jgi:uncharacterized protein DUF1353
MTPAFRSKLIFEDERGLPYTLSWPLVYDSGILNRTITVPTGFPTDLASIPRGLWNVLPKSSSYDKAAVVHDYCYVTNGMSRGQADAVLREAMEVIGVPGWQRWAMYTAVRAGGWRVWNRYRAQETPTLRPAA